MRWRHPERGMISPAEFIPLAEETGLIGALGLFALRRACCEAAHWPGDIRVAVNLSAAQFMAPDFARVVKRELDAAGLKPHRLELEVTETLLLQDNVKTKDALHELRAMGIAIALDDFGTGYASLSYLRSFPFDKIKIDQTFVRDLPARPDCVAIVRAVSGLARDLGMKTVAEGVETPDHLARVMEAGCDEAQGYLFCRPVPAGDLLEFLRGRVSA
jgi:EAL domain-containing protein (putative c-di-GMP-specific phosphodiesterase class I)